MAHQVTTNRPAPNPVGLGPPFRRAMAMTSASAIHNRECRDIVENVKMGEAQASSISYWLGAIK